MINRMLDVVGKTMAKRYHADRDGGDYFTTEPQPMSICEILR